MPDYLRYACLSNNEKVRTITSEPFIDIRRVLFD
jgi:hypothetical protein